MSLVKTRGPEYGTVLVPAVREGIQGRGLPDQEQDGDKDVRGRQNFNFHWTPEDEDVQEGDRNGDEDVDVLRRPGKDANIAQGIL